MLPVVHAEVLYAHVQKLTHDLVRGNGRVTASGLLVQAMPDNSELASSIIRFGSRMEDVVAREFAMVLVCATYQALRAQIESDTLESLE